MKAYELMLMLDPSIEDEARSAVLTRVRDIVAADGGAVDEVDEWGKRRLAYEVKGFTDAEYVVCRLHATSAAVAEMDRVLHITDPVVRYMLVRADGAA